jgi:nitrogen regulatory protein P-II 1
MKELKAFVRHGKVNDVVSALRTAGACSLTVVPVVPVGVDAPLDFVDISTARPTEHPQHVVKIELVCRDRESDAYAEIVRTHAFTGERGDGMVFVSAVDDAGRIRTGVHGEDAL